jgi:hypothetical protein
MTIGDTPIRNPLKPWKCKSCTDGTCRVCRENTAWAARFDGLYGKEMKEYYAPRHTTDLAK